MKNKKFLMVSLVLLAILTIGAVSASEDITDDTQIVSVSDDGISEDILTVSEEGADMEDAPVVNSPSANDGDDSIQSVDDEIILGEGDGEEEENPYYTFITDEAIITDSGNEDYDENAIVAGIILPPDTSEGRFNAFVDDKVLFNGDMADVESDWHYDEAGNRKCHIYLKDLNLEDIYNGAQVEFSFWVGDEKIEKYTLFVKVEVTDSAIRFYKEGGEQNDADDGVVIYVPNGEEREYDLGNQEDMSSAFAIVSISNDLQGYIRVYYDNDDENVHIAYFDKTLDEISNKEEDPDYEGFTRYYISLNDLSDFESFLDWRYFRVGFSLASDDIDSREEIESHGYNIEYNDDGGIVKFWEDNGDDEGDDANDGVVIYVPNGDDDRFDLENPEDMNRAFAFISVSDDFQGNIRIWVFDEEEDTIFFEKSLSEITNTEPDEREGFTRYLISLSDLGENLDAFLDRRYFEIGFFIDEDGELNRVDSRGYNIEYYDDEDIISFWEAGDDEGIHGEGEQIEAEFISANTMDNGVVVIIPKENIPDDVDNEFVAVILQDDEPNEITFRLDEILEGNNYILRVNDFDLPEFGESYGLFMFLQFYSDGEKTYYAEYWDDEEGIYIFASPYIFDETSLYLDDDVITIQEIPEGVDEFIITISKEGSEDIVKTFRFSEMDIDEEELWVAFKLNDLGITEEGDYSITVKYSDDLVYNGNIHVNSNLEIWPSVEEDEGGPHTFESVDEKVAKIRISESVSGYVKIYVDGNQVGGNINFADLPMGKWPTGRKVLLNHLKIYESGEHTVKLEAYSDSDELLAEEEFDILVEVSDFSVHIDEGALPYGVEGILEFMVGKPVSDGQYFNIYFNDVKAGNFTVNDGLQMFDEFTIPMFDVKILKPGNFNVRVTFFDGETETDVATGSCSINELELFSDKEVYVYGIDPVIISFNMDSVEDDDGLRAYFVYGWDEVQRDDSMVFNPYGGQDMINDGLYKDGKVSFDIAHFGGEPDNDNYRLDLGETLIYVVYKFANGERLGGFIKVKVVEELEPIDPELSVEGPTEDIVFGSPVTITITAVDSFNGEVRVIMDGNVVNTTTLTNGQGTVTIDADKFAVGDNLITVQNVADEDYMADSEEITVTVIKADSDVSVDSISFVYGESGTATATWTNATGVEAVIEGDLGNVLVEGNVITVSGLDAGNYNLFVTTIPGLNYLAKTITVPVTVSKADSGVSVDSISFDYGDSGSAVATFTGATGVDASIEGYPDAVSVAGNVITVSGLNAGTYTMTVTTDPDGNHNAVTIEVPVTVNKAPSSISIGNIAFNYGSSGNTTVEVTNGTVDLANIAVVGHPEATIKLVDNVITVSGLSAGTYTLSVTTTPIDDNHQAVTKTANITVKKLTTKLTAPNVTAVYAVTKKLIITLRDANGKVLAGKKVSVKVGTIYKNYTTNASGQVSVIISNLVPKTYTAVIKFAGDSNYVGSSVNATVVVKKATPKLTALAKSFRVGVKTKKYVVTLKTHLGKLMKYKKLTLRIKGKTFYAKTNSKGKATFKITNLKRRGTFYAVVKYAGSKYYRAITKKPKIKVVR